MIVSSEPLFTLPRPPQVSQRAKREIVSDIVQLRAILTWQRPGRVWGQGVTIHDSDVRMRKECPGGTQMDGCSREG